MKLDILISTTNDRIFYIQDLFLKPQKDIRYVVSHQIYNNKEYDINFGRNDVIYKKSKIKGLSRNRNITTSMASSDICLFADDDVKYKREWLNDLIIYFKENPRMDILTFKIKTNESEPQYKEYQNHFFMHDLRSIFQVSSIETAFRLNKIKDAGLSFDENYGLGTNFNFGEENIFLMDALSKGLKIKYIPYYIVNHPYNKLRKIDTHKEILTSGALFYRMFGLFAIFMDLYSTYYNYKDYKLCFSIFKYIKVILKGNYLGFKTSKNKTPFFTMIKLIGMLLKNKIENKFLRDYEIFK